MKPPCRGTGHHAFRAVGAALIATAPAVAAVLPPNPHRDTGTAVAVFVVVVVRTRSPSSPPPPPPLPPPPSPVDLRRRHRRRRSRLVWPPCGWCRASRAGASLRTRNPPRPLAVRVCCTTASRPTSSRSASFRQTPLRRKSRTVQVWSRPTVPG